MKDQKESIKSILSEILFLEEDVHINDNDFLGTLGFSSIDYVDFCFALKNKISPTITPENLWPIPQLQDDDTYFDGKNWHEVGEKKLREILFLEQKDDLFDDLNKHFTVSYVDKRINFLSSQEKSK